MTSRVLPDHGHNASLAGTVEGFHLTERPAPLRGLAADLWRSRQLALMLGRRNFFVRYRRASFGIMWAAGLPLIQAIVMAVVFSLAVRLRIPHYAVFVFAGMFSWAFFSTTVSAGATAIVDGAGLSSRIYFPRAVLAIVTVAGNVYGFVVTLAILLLAAAAFGVMPGVRTLLLVPAAVLTILLATVLSLLLSALHVYFRDIRYIVTALMTAWFYLTPVFYPLRLAPGALRRVIQLNPATGFVELFRAATVGADRAWVLEVGICCAWLLVLGVAAVLVHRRYDRLFADLL